MKLSITLKLTCFSAISINVTTKATIKRQQKQNKLQLASWMIHYKEISSKNTNSTSSYKWVYKKKLQMDKLQNKENR